MADHSYDHSNTNTTNTIALHQDSQLLELEIIEDIEENSNIEVFCTFLLNT